MNTLRSLSAGIGAAPQATDRRPMPKAPVLAWSDFRHLGSGGAPNIGLLPHRAYVSSGRAALHAALRQCALPPGTRVLVPTYHCPTMVAPIVEAGCTPEYYAIDARGLPRLELIDPRPGERRVMFVAHFFGLPHSLAEVQAWCRTHGVVMVEDCAHSYFGMAGERPVGHWGDYATTSIAKFFPVPEAGLLASARMPLKPLALEPCGLRTQLRTAWDVLHRSHDHGELAGLRHLVAPVLHLRGRGKPVLAPIGPDEQTDQEIIDGCDMGRIRQQLPFAAAALHRLVPLAGMVRSRRRHFMRYGELLATAPGAQPLNLPLDRHAAPYVYPLWVDGAERADAVYARMRADRLPVFRWDRLWPGTPRLAGDEGALWGRQVLQLLCHQSLHDDEIDHVAERTLHALRTAPSNAS